MKSLALCLALISFNAAAHIELGTYRGETPDRTECNVEIKSVSFVTAFRHPLAERVSVVAFDKTFVLQHPVKATESSVSFDDESLETAIPFPGGAEFFKISMSHEEGNEGPKAFLHVTHDWKNAKVTTLSCGGLVFTGK